MKKTIKIPEPVLLTDPESGKTGDKVSFYKFVRHALLCDNQFGGGFEGIRAALEIDRALSKHPFGEIDLEDTSVARLAAAAKTPSMGCYPGFPILVVMQLGEFFEAIFGATNAMEIRAAE